MSPPHRVGRLNPLRSRLDIDDDFVWPIRHGEFCPHLHTTVTLAANPYDEDGYCCWCGNGSWKFHAPWCRWADVVEELVALIGGR